MNFYIITFWNITAKNIMELSAENKILLEAIYKRFDENEAKLKEEINKLKTANEELKHRIESSEKKIVSQNEIILQLQKRINSNNIIIHGIEPMVNEANLEDAVIDLLNSKLELHVNRNDIQQVYQLGNNKRSNNPIKVTLNSHKMKLNIFKEKKKLMGTSIFINNDLPKELRIREAEERKKRKESNAKRGHKRPGTQSSNEIDEMDDKIKQDQKRSNYRDNKNESRYIGKN